MFFWGFGHQATNLIVTDSDDLYEPCPFAQAVQKNLNDVKDRASKAWFDSFILWQHFGHFIQACPSDGSRGRLSTWVHQVHPPSCHYQIEFCKHRFLGRYRETRNTIRASSNYHPPQNYRNHGGLVIDTAKLTTKKGKWDHIKRIIMS